MNKVEIMQPKMKGRNDSFWYDGLVAVCGDAKLYAVGEIRIINKNGDLVHDGYKTRNDGFPEFGGYIRDDNDLSKLEEFGYTWDYNNWFSVIVETKDKPYDEDVVVGYGYDEAILQLYEIGNEDVKE